MARPPKTRIFHEAGSTLTLRERNGHYELTIGEVPILTSAALGTERAFGNLAKKLRVREAPRVLIGGLGFGSTLAGVLEVVSEGAQVLVVEKLATVVSLVRGELAHLSKGAIDDRRVTLIADDVSAVIARETDLDVILLDVDNGPDWASFQSNARLYDRRGLEAARDALIDKGSYAVWAGYPADGFRIRLRDAGFAESVVLLREHGRVQARAYLGKKR